MAVLAAASERTSRIDLGAAVIQPAAQFSGTVGFEEFSDRPVSTA